MELIDFDNLTHEERTKAKNTEEARITIAKIEHKKAIEIAKKLIELGSDNGFIAKATNLSVAQIENIRHEEN
jgi:serine protease inhibitor